MPDSKQPHRLLKFDLISRLAILAQASTTVTLGWYVPQSLTARLLADGGTYGYITLILFTACVIAGLVDAVINDFLPASIYLTWICKRRHSVYHALATLYFVQAYVGVGVDVGLEDLLPLGYMLTGIVTAWYSWTTSLRGGDAC